MTISKHFDIIDAETGEVYYTVTSKYSGERVLENAMRYCQKHGYKFHSYSICNDKFTGVYIIAE